MSKSKPSRTAEQAFQEAFTLHCQGRLLEADQQYRAVLKIDPSHSSALHHLGVVCADQGKLDEALGLLRLAVKRNPQLAAAYNDLGIVLAKMRRPEEAILQHQTALSLHPNDAAAHNNLGVALQSVGRLDEAAACYERALAINPQYAEAHNNLGNILAARQQFEAAMASYVRAITINPRYAQAHYNCGNLLMVLQRPDEAARAYAHALQLNPQYVDAYVNLGNLMASCQRYEQAVASYEKAVAIDPRRAALHYNIGNVMALWQRHHEAIASFDRAIGLDANYADAYNNRGNSLEALQRDEEAITSYEKAIAVNPQCAPAYNNLGNVRKTMGDLEKAQLAIARAIELLPTKGEFYRNLGECKRFTAADAQVAAMQELAKNMDALSVEDQMHLHFALAKALDDIGEYHESFRHLLDGNALKRRQIVYDEAATLQGFNRIRVAFSASLMQQKQKLGAASSQPVFIIGMPRSGTTLVEQILSSHPQVFGAGEIDDFAKAMADVLTLFPELVATMQGEQLLQVGTSYLNRIRMQAPEAQRIVDKMPENFLFAGLIHLVLPDARIIHTRRDTVDTCVSCFGKMFVQGHPYTYDLSELGRYYRGYEALMQHWREVLPPPVMLEVQYEDVVADLEKEARRIVSHCGLEWDDACLAFHKTPRKVRTASASQVRQPIYATSVKRWHHFRELLQPLLQSLGVE